MKQVMWVAAAVAALFSLVVIASTPDVLVFTDGTRMDVEHFELRGTIVVFATEDGKLHSVPASLVDRAATAEANGISYLGLPTAVAAAPPPPTTPTLVAQNGEGTISVADGGSPAVGVDIFLFANQGKQPSQRREWPSNNDGVARSGFGTRSVTNGLVLRPFVFSMVTPMAIFDLANLIPSHHESPRRALGQPKRVAERRDYVHTVAWRFRPPGGSRTRSTKMRTNPHNPFRRARAKSLPFAIVGLALASLLTTAAPASAKQCHIRVSASGRFQGQVIDQGGGPYTRFAVKVEYDLSNVSLRYDFDKCGDGCRETSRALIGCQPVGKLLGKLYWR